MASIRCASCILLVTAFFHGYMANAWETETNEGTVQAAVDEFYTALNRVFVGDLKEMDSIWSHSDNVTYHGPTGGIKHGWQAVRQDWVKQAKLRLGGKVKPEKLTYVIGRDIAVVSNYEIGENIGRDRKPIRVAIRATSTFRKEEGKWKMIGHHADPLPYLSETN